MARSARYRPCLKDINKTIISAISAMGLVLILAANSAFPETPSDTIKREVKPSDPKPQIERGQPNYVIDVVGSIASIPQKVILLNPNIDSHIVKPKTEQYLKDFIRDNADVMKDVKVRINQCSPIQELDRLVKNKRVSLIWRIFPGIPITIWSSLKGRILGGDNYNPYTNTISIYSDDPAVALHEACHAKDIMSRQDGLERDAYVIGRIFSPVVLYQEYTASDEAIDYLKKKGSLKDELDGYSTLYPAFGTYAGAYSGLPYGNIAGAFVGHGFGIWKRYERMVCRDNVKFGSVCKELESDPLARELLTSKRTKDESLAKALSAAVKSD